MALLLRTREGGKNRIFKTQVEEKETNKEMQNFGTGTIRIRTRTSIKSLLSNTIDSTGMSGTR